MGFPAARPPLVGDVSMIVLRMSLSDPRPDSWGMSSRRSGKPAFLDTSSSELLSIARRSMSVSSSMVSSSKETPEQTDPDAEYRDRRRFFFFFFFFRRRPFLPLPLAFLAFFFSSCSARTLAMSSSISGSPSDPSPWDEKELSSASSPEADVDMYDDPEAPDDREDPPSLA